MKTPALFQPDAAAIQRLVAGHPLAQVFSTDQGRPVCTPLPLLLVHDAAGEAWLVGHFARNNPQVAALRREPRALAVFMGAQGYISPSWLQDRTQAPTWNFETVHFEVEVHFDERPEATFAALEQLVAHVEHGRPQAWSAGDMGPRYQRLAQAVIAFRARVTATHAKFKLGQNERPDVHADILRGLETTGQQALLAAMRRVPAPGG